METEQINKDLIFKDAKTGAIYTEKQIINSLVATNEFLYEKIKDQQELIELADGLINGRSSEFEKFEEKLIQYKNNYQ